MAVEGDMIDVCDYFRCWVDVTRNSKRVILTNTGRQRHAEKMNAMDWIEKRTQ